MLGSPIKDLVSHKTTDELHRLSYCALVVFRVLFTVYSISISFSKRRPS